MLFIQTIGTVINSGENELRWQKWGREKESERLCACNFYSAHKAITFKWPRSNMEKLEITAKKKWTHIQSTVEQQRQYGADILLLRITSWVFRVFFSSLLSHVNSFTIFIIFTFQSTLLRTWSLCFCIHWRSIDIFEFWMDVNFFRLLRRQ